MIIGTPLFQENTIMFITEVFLSNCFFHKEQDKDIFLGKFRKLLNPLCYLRGFCLMDNHFHLIIKVKEYHSCLTDNNELVFTNTMIENLSRIEDKMDYLIVNQFQRLFKSHALKINKRENRHGALFQKRFKRVTLKSYDRFLEMLMYTHHNIIHHDLTTVYGNYKYSSYDYYLNYDNSFVDTKWIIEDLGKGDKFLAVNIFTKMHEEYKIKYLKNLSE